MSSVNGAPLSPRPQSDLDLTRFALGWEPPELIDVLAWVNDDESNDSENYPGLASRWGDDEPIDNLDALDRELAREKGGHP